MKLDPVSVSLLCDYYGPLLTDNQRRCLELYCDQDLSLAEIAEQEGISRQGVHAAIVRAEAVLAGYEEKLGCVARARSNRAAAARAREAARRILARSEDEAAREAAAEILRALDRLEE